MLPESIKQRLMSSGLYDCIVDTYDKHGTGDQHGSLLDDLDRFAKIVAEECAAIAYLASDDGHIAAQSILFEFDVDGARSQK